MNPISIMLWSGAVTCVALTASLVYNLSTGGKPKLTPGQIVKFFGGRDMVITDLSGHGDSITAVMLDRETFEQNNTVRGKR